jgi:hypothetical protein
MMVIANVAGAMLVATVKAWAALSQSVIGPLAFALGSRGFAIKLSCSCNNCCCWAL